MHIAIPTPCPMSLSARLIRLRRERDWTQQDVAEQVGRHVNQIKRYEAGSVQPSLEGLRKIAKAFSVSTDWLLFEDAERGPDEDLHLQFEAMNQLTPEEKDVARAAFEGLLTKHVAQVGQPQQRSKSGRGGGYHGKQSPEQGRAGHQGSQARDSARLMHTHVRTRREQQQ